MEFTTRQNVASFTAAAALDPDAPRDLHIAGEVLDARGLARAATVGTGKKHGTLRAGSLERLQKLIRVTRFLTPQTDDPFPAWQGMQYTRDMFSGEAFVGSYDNDRYPVDWTPVSELFAHPARFR